MQLSDYDGRTALHVAASEGHPNVVKFLLFRCHVDYNVKDRYVIFLEVIIGYKEGTHVDKLIARLGCKFAGQNCGAVHCKNKCMGRIIFPWLALKRRVDPDTINPWRWPVTIKFCNFCFQVGSHAIGRQSPI